MAADKNELDQWLEDYDALHPLGEGTLQFFKGAMRVFADLHPDWVQNLTRKDFFSWIERGLHLWREVDEHVRLAIASTLNTETDDIVVSVLLSIKPLNIPQNIETICALQLLINEFLEKASKIIPGSSLKTEKISPEDEERFRQIMEGLKLNDQSQNKSQ